MRMLQFSSSKHQLAYMQNLLESKSMLWRKNIDLRFQNIISLLGTLTIFDPAHFPSKVSELPSYGVDFITVLAKCHFPDQQVRLLAEWNILKYHMKEMTLPADVNKGRTIMLAEWCMCKLMRQRSSSFSFLLLMQIVEIELTMPERGASQVKLIKTRLGNRIGNDMLPCIINIAKTGPMCLLRVKLQKKTDEKSKSSKKKSRPSIH